MADEHSSEHLAHNSQLPVSGPQSGAPGLAQMKRWGTAKKKESKFSDGKTCAA
jgi:hypothetical protein